MAMQAFSASHEAFAAVTDDNRLKVWDVRSGQLEHDLRERDHLSYQYTCLAWAARAPLGSSAGTKRGKAAAAASSGQLALGTSSGAIVIWDLRQAAVVQRLTASSSSSSSAGAVRDVAFNAQGSRLYSVAAGERHALEWDLATGQVARRFRCDADGAHRVAVCPRDETLVVGGVALRTFDLASGKKARKLVAGLSSAVATLRFSPCQRFLLVAAVGARFVNLYDLAMDAAQNDEPVATFAMPSSAASLLLRDATPTSKKPSKKKSKTVELLVGAVAHTGTLYLWGYSHKASSSINNSKPLTPDVTSVVRAAPENDDDEEQDEDAEAATVDAKQSASIRLATLVEKDAKDKSSEDMQLLVARGASAKPIFETVALLDAHQQLRASLAFAPLSTHLLLPEGPPSKKHKHGDEIDSASTATQVPALAARSGRATAHRAVDATAASSDEEEVEEEEEDDSELTLAERVEALREKVENDVAAELAQDMEPEASGASSERPDASSLATLLQQALQAKDNAMVEYCLRSRNAKVIATTIQRVPSVHVLALLDLLVAKCDKTPARVARLCPWLRAMLLHHTAYLLTQPDLVQSLSALYQLLEQRLAAHAALQRLAGKLSLVLGQIHETQASTAAATSDADDAPQAKTVYREDAEEEEDAAGEDDEAEEEEDASSDDGEEQEEDEEEEEDDDDDDDDDDE